MKKDKHLKRQANKVRKSIEKIPLSDLMKYNLTSYEDDLDVLAELISVKKSSRDWIINTRYDLQLKANRYERMFGKFLLDNKIRFLHQAPFVVCGKIYFVDFYIPQSKTIIELDGAYHESLTQKELDNERDRDLKWSGCKVIRIKNTIVLNKALLKTKLKINGILKDPK